MSTTIKIFFSKPIVRYFLFWLFVFIFSSISSGWYFSGFKEVMITYFIRVLFQFIVAHFCVFILIPRLLDKNYKGLFALAMFVLLFIVFFSCTLIRMFYLEIAFPKTYANYLNLITDASLTGRVFSITAFLGKSTYLLYPTFLLLAYKFYNEQQQLLKLNEQKKTAELTALKNQLNPHFLFNTLNNLYALAFKKSDKTTHVIQKLSEILDYTLYGSNHKFVMLQKEIELIENYIVLEKIRYDDRISVSFNKELESDGKIAPLLLLTFVENAFKHGVSQELEEAFINIKIKQNKDEILFSIENSKPKPIISETKTKENIGLKNVKKQLELVYPKKHDLDITETKNTYKVNLKLVTV